MDFISDDMLIEIIENMTPVSIEEEIPSPPDDSRIKVRAVLANGAEPLELDVLGKSGCVFSRERDTMTLVPSKQYSVWVEYWEEGETHGHLLLIKNHDEMISMSQLLVDIEEYADELADMFSRCGNQSHGHGIKHSTDTVRRAYEAAVFQLLTTDYEAEWSEIQRKIRIYQKWGGQVPAMILQPAADDHKQWQALIPDKEGNPSLYKLRKGILDDIMDPRAGARPNKYGLGWTLKGGRN